MSADRFPATFIERFNQIWLQARRVELSQAVCWAILTTLAGLSLLAAADYWLELSQLTRTAAVILIGAASIGVTILLIARSFRRRQRQMTAAAIEHVFPQLGQRIRTMVQFSDLTRAEISGAGLASTLVAALDDDTIRRAQPLPLDAVVPWKSLALASLSAAVLAVALAGASALSWEWRAAARRAFLGEQPYTTISVEPGHVVIQQGESLPIRITVRGRTGRNITFQSRRVDETDSPWRDENLTWNERARTPNGETAVEVPLERILHPLEYRVSAGSATTEVYRVTVRYPLKIVAQRITIQPPEYTGLPETTSETGDVAALVGSRLKLQIELDREPETAWLEVQALKRNAPGEEAATARVPLTIDDNKLTAELDLTSDQSYCVVAAASDGMKLGANRFRLRAKVDEPPQVWFDAPAESLEVHTLAEILMRIRASDDFGLSRVGIMFEINNEEEYQLLAKDFEAAADELRSAGAMTPETKATLEKVLPLEHFKLSQQDSVMYYAFAEDIKPGHAQRTETDLRFIDIRPFRRNYRTLDLPDGEGGGPPRFKALAELIARQRSAINRASQLDRKQKHDGQPDLPGTDALIQFQTELAQATRDIAEGLLQRGVDETELLSQAETAMLAATDSLSAGNYDTAITQMRDALKYLIEGRNRLEVFVFKNGNRSLLTRLREFDRLQQQRLRKPKSDEEQARQLVQQLEELAQQEESVCATCAGLAAKKLGLGSSRSTGESGSPGQSASNSESAAKDSSTEQGAENAAQKMEELLDRQLDVAAVAREVEKALTKLPKATDLAKERMSGAAQQAEDAADAVGRGALDEAQAMANAAKDQFRELAEQVKALLAEEQASRIAAAKKMAAELARQQQQFRDRLARSPNPGVNNQPQEMPNQTQSPGMSGGQQAKPSQKQPMPGLAGMAQELAEKSKTLADVLGATVKPQSQSDQKSAEEVERVMKSLDLKGVADRLAELPGQVAGARFQDARTVAEDGAERMEAAAEQLAVLHRTIVAPRVQELAKLEQDAMQLDRELDKLDTDARVTAWHSAMDGLLGKLEDLQVADGPRDELRDEMRKAGWGRTRGNWGWSRTSAGSFAAPTRYRLLLTQIADSLRGRMQEYMLGDTQATGDEPIPPQYQELVDRYYRVLMAETKGNARQPANALKTAPENK